MTRVVVVGGGISGLASAFFVREARPGCSVTILEGSARPGGNIRTLREGGMPVEAGPDAVVMGRPEVGALFDKLGLTAGLVSPGERASRVLLAGDGALHAFPDGMVFGMPTRFQQLASTPLLSLRGKLRAALDLVLPASSEAPRSVGELVERRLGREVKERLVEPMVGGIFAADIDRLDPSAGLPMLASTRGSLIRAMAGVKRPKGSPLRAPASGMSRIVDELVRAVDPTSLRLTTTAKRVTRRGRRYEITTEDGHTLDCDHAVLAVSPRSAATLLSDLDPALSAAAGELSLATTATVLLVFPTGTRLPDASGLLVPRTEQKATLAATFVNTKWARRSQSGEIVIRAFLGGARAPSLIDDSDDAHIAALALADLRCYLPLPDPVRTVVVRFVGGTPQPELGHAARVTQLRRLAARHPGLSLVSAAYEGPGIAGCIAQAARVGATLRSATHATLH